MTEVTLETIVTKVVQAVVRELEKSGIKIISSGSGTMSSSLIENNMSGLQHKTERIDMSRYRTPVLTENHINKLHELTGSIIVPKGTVYTPKAKQALRNKHICVIEE